MIYVDVAYKIFSSESVGDNDKALLAMAPWVMPILVFHSAQGPKVSTATVAVADSKRFLCGDTPTI